MERVLSRAADRKHLSPGSMTNYYNGAIPRGESFYATPPSLE